jgi:multimeric flavodoxin WrbA
MKIVVLNGSPKGDISVTMQYIHYIQKQFPQHELEIHNISQRIKKLESDEGAFQAVIEAVREADGIIWAFPLYLLLVPSQYKRFIELIWERDVAGAFKGKYATALTTSIHFFDHTAHNYMNAICDDLGMRYVDGFSAAMRDLLEEPGQKKVTQFARTFFDAIEKRMPTIRNYPPLVFEPIDYVPGEVEHQVDAGKKRVVVLTDVEDSTSNLAKMVERFRTSFAGDVEVINLHDVDIKGGCLGCLQCGYESICVYGDKDDFVAFYNDKVRQADLLVWAGTIRDRYLSSRWKMFFDRSFFKNHQPTLHGKQMGMIVSGPLGQIPNLRQLLEGWTEIEEANRVGFVTDEYDSSAEVDALLQNLAERLIYCADVEYVKPRTFLGVGGMKIFRDDIYSHMRFPFLADHQYYKQHGLYDFPQKELKSRMVADMLILLTKIPKMREDIYIKRMKGEMIKPFQKIFAD